MASFYWIKLYHESLDDPKVARLPDNLWRRFFECCLLAGEMYQDGRLPPITEMAWRLRVDEESLKKELELLRRSGLLDHRVDHVLDDGFWFVVNFAKRQAAMTPAERMKRYRESKRKGEYYCYEGGDDTVTNRNTDIDIDIDKIRSEEERAAASVTQAYQSNIGPLTAMIREEILEALDEFPSGWILESIRLSVEYNKRSWKYCRTILDRWQRDGKDDGRGKKSAVDIYAEAGYK